MINTAEIFDDIGESRAVQQYGEEIVAKMKVESIAKFLHLGLTPAQIADALDVPLATVENIAQIEVGQNKNV